MDNLPLAAVDYTLTWNLMGGTAQFTLSADGYFDFSPDKVELGTSAQVMAIAAILAESGINVSGGNGSEMAFDNLRVTGKEPAPAVPEPGVPGLLVAGLAALWVRRRS